MAESFNEALKAFKAQHQLPPAADVAAIEKALTHESAEGNDRESSNNTPA